MTTTTHSLRDLLEVLTGCDATTEPDFAWSDGMPCDTCGATTSTALVSLDGNTKQRLCFECLAVAP